ncbi:TIGR03790 family protein [Methylobacter sp. S3L5C]|uniref:TIGR03790 family protein n=1 Tax=Methylobacter sp. S3L5C TaxID=2839024 RepID=UPI001FAD0266|nr:TIGR03790 family protein [Methylobacter sp. S3L5C]UOA10181.1 TIGR03790 family protein [Methylobacter sp. S3L5C]
MPIKKPNFITLALVLLFFTDILHAATIPLLYRPLPALTSKQLAVIVNDEDPLSIRITNYYQDIRQIPPENIIHIRFDASANALSKKEFAVLKHQVDKQTPNQVQAFVLTWLKPFRVDCMSITTAFAAGFDKAFCAKVCEETRKSPYFSSDSQKPFTDYRWRPTMTLAGRSFEDVKRLIDRGVASDFTRPQGSAYLLKTSDQARSTRAIYFPEVAKVFAGQWPVNYLEQNSLENKTDVMFYFTGLMQVPNIDKNTYLPGAIADHLTSTGGVLTGSNQMNILDWITAGATASYGAVVEPCNYPVKFSHPGILLYYYLRGNSLIEAYWKSVSEPGQGIFVGEPLARPFASPPIKQAH